MDKKYEMIPEGDLFRIRALRNFSGVIKGEFGGLIEKEDNLSHYGGCWITYDARVLENARIIGDALVSGSAIVDGNSCIIGDATVMDNARVTGYATITSCALVYGNSLVKGSAIVKDATVCGAHIYGRAYVYGRADLYGDAEVSADNDYIVFKNWWSSGRYFTWTRSNNMWKVGCFHGTGEELVRKAYQDSEDKGKQYKKIVDYVNSLEL